MYALLEVEKDLTCVLLRRYDTIRQITASLQV